MVEELDVWRSANVLVQRYGQDAPLEAAIRADGMLEKGSPEGQAIWLQIKAAAEEILRTVPRESERVQ